MKRQLWSWLRMLGGLGILLVLLWHLGSGAFLDGLRRIDAGTLLAGLGIGVLTTVCSAWRWCLVARGLGLRLPLGRAVAEYYRALFLNAALPGGVLGDVNRAVCHGRATGDVGRGVRAVVLERVAGQLVLLVVGTVALAVRPSPVRTALGRALGTPAAGAVGAAVAAAVLAAVLLGRARGRRTGAGGWPGGRLRVALAEVGRAGALWSGVAALSLVVLAGYVATFLLAARVAGVRAPVADLVPLVLLALSAMALPLNVGGWGPREGVAAWAFGVAGLGAGQGLATAVVYGALVLAASLPGAGVLLGTVRWVGVGQTLDRVRHVRAAARSPQLQLEERVLAQHAPAHRRP
ncbi:MULTISPECIES: lysylphosphatidylglycerol synthase transmembrane domain-containing protein [Streptomyces]|uniref:lysylphosphatidylglycerol synthase transmembrane domain-containing protein n=1 Tax=Streptomyces TaxID=1883 RepID=UPI001965CA46|nr:MULTISPECIES: lysylphosphatidylglycerol synthase transmembrane domain-containing protein [Streptomyces]QRX90800.1 flippase-like domain-containing protein [Streptomyces noursei]UJB40721.1 flippase-like domain-containing protein [Streptomyces sp. A1-5]